MKSNESENFFGETLRFSERFSKFSIQQVGESLASKIRRVSTPGSMLSLLILKNDTKLSGESEGIVTKAVHAELKARNIKLTENEMNKLTLRNKVHRIRAHEFKELRTTRDLKQETDVSDVEPFF